MASISRPSSDDRATPAIPYDLRNSPAFPTGRTLACAYNLAMNDSEASLPEDVALCHELIRQQADSLERAQRRIEQLNTRWTYSCVRSTGLAVNASTRTS